MVCTTLRAPKPAMPRRTVTPAAPCFRSALEERDVQRTAVPLIRLAEEDPEQRLLALEYPMAHASSCPS